MAQQSKFSGALARLHAPDEPEVEQTPSPPTPLELPEPVAEPVAQIPIKPPAVTTKGRGRPPGKRSDPEFEPSNLLLRKRTKRAAVRTLEDKGSKQDLSDLVEHLLSQWTKRQA